MFLYFILARRLLERKPTILQYREDVVHLFDGSGVSTLPLSYENFPHNSRSTWALVDSNQFVPEPAKVLSRVSCRYFLILASSPRLIRWDDVQRFRGPVNHLYMQPFTLEELIQA